MILVLATLMLLSEHCRASEERGFSTDASYWMARLAPPAHTADDLLLLPPDPISGCEFARSTAEPWIYASRNTCKAFPRYYDISLDIEKLQIKSTGITAIKRGDLFRMSHLSSMSIEMNDKLETIEGGVFINMTRMTNLSISNNYNLKTLPPDVFQGLDHLVELTLSKTNILSIESIATAVSTARLPRLSILDLSHNLLNEIRENDLKPMKGSALQTLRLSFCNLNYIHQSAFNVLFNLESLTLGQNYLNTTVVTNLLLGITRSCPNFTDINLDQLPIDAKPTDLLQVIAESNITELSLKRIPLEPLVTGFFPAMPNLRRLDLSEVLAADLQINTLNTSTMPRLSTLILAQNTLNGMLPGVLLPQVVNLDISGNSGDDSRPAKFIVQPESFTVMRKIKFLNLSYNRLMFVYNNTFDGLERLRVLLLSNASIYRLDDYSFRPMRELKVLDLKNNIFPIYFNLTSKTFFGLDSLELLNLELCGITYIHADVFTATKNLVYLILRNNHIITLGSDFLRSITDLTILDVSINMVTPWNKRLFHDNDRLSTIYLSNNQLTCITPSMLSDLATIDSISLQDNPFACDCNMKQSVKDVQNVSSQVKRFKTTCFSPKKWQNVALEIFFIQDTSVCEMSKVFLFCAFCIATAVLGFGISVTYYYRSRVYYWWFITRVKLRGKRTLKGEINYQYDAFVSYSSDDRSFVVRLVAMLENYEPFLKLCVYERDFQIGDLISETVMESVAVSRRVILIVSDSFAKSQWCKWEMQIAQHHQLFLEVEGEMSDPLIMIKLGDVLNAHLTPTLRYLMKTRVFLEWDSEPIKQRLFWEKLRATLLPAISYQELNL